MVLLAYTKMRMRERSRFLLQPLKPFRSLVLLVLGVLFFCIPPSTSSTPALLSASDFHVHVKDVHLGQGDDISFKIYASSSRVMNETQLSLFKCYWVLASRLSEDDSFAGMIAPTASQIFSGTLADGSQPQMRGSFDVVQNSAFAKGKSSDFGDVIFATVIGAGTRNAANVQRINLPRRCRYKLNAVVTLSNWIYAKNLTYPLSDHASASFSRFHSVTPYQQDASYREEPTTASLASQVYLSGGTTDANSDWMDWSGNFKASNYWVDPSSSGKSWRMFHFQYASAKAAAEKDTTAAQTNIDSSMTPIVIERIAETNIGEEGPTLQETHRRLFGMASVYMKTSSSVSADKEPSIFHVGGIDDLRGVLAQNLVLVLSSDGSEGSWVTLPKSWDLQQPRHSHAVVPWTNTSGDGRQYIFAIGGITSDGTYLRNVEVLTLPETTPFGNAAQSSPQEGWKLLEGRLRVFRARASAAVGPDDTLYVIGGESAMRGEVERCNLRTGCTRFEDISPLRKPRYAGAAVWSQEMQELMYIGGFRVGPFCDYEKVCSDNAPSYDGLVAGPSTDVESYHPETNSWNFRPPMQVARYGLSATEIAVPNPLYVRAASESNDKRTWKQQQPVRYEILAIGGVGGLVWKKQNPMSPRRLNSVEIFSCYMFSEASQRCSAWTSLFSLGLAALMVLYEIY